MTSPRPIAHNDRSATPYAAWRQVLFTLATRPDLGPVTSLLTRNHPGALSMTPTTLRATFPVHLVESFAFGEALLRKNLVGVTDGHAIARPVEGGNSILWVVGHIAYWRNQVVGMLGGTPNWPEDTADLFKGMTRGEPPSTEGWTLLQVMQGYDGATERLRAAFSSAPGPGGFEQVLDGLGKLALHEIYHVGQVGTLRRVVGLEGAV